MNEKLKEKINESLSSILPISIIVLMVCLFIVPVSSETLVSFVVGSLFLIIGMGLFSLGADVSLTRVGERVGASLSKSKKVWVIAFISFILGIITTYAELDLNVLATLVPGVPKYTLISAVSIGTAIFLVIAMLRIVFKIKLSNLLFVLYFIVFIISYWVPKGFLAIAFDSGGVTTGPMIVPFIIALGIGAVSIRNDKSSESDSFGLAALCSIGPIIAMMLIGIFFRIGEGTYTSTIINSIKDSKMIGFSFLNVIPQYAMEVFKSILPIVLFFILYNLLVLKLSTQQVRKISMGFVYLFVGLVIFLIGVNEGFLPMGYELGKALMTNLDKTIILPIIMAIGYFIVKAEPAVQVLIRQVVTTTDGMISESMMLGTLSVGMMMALIIGACRAWYGISFMAFMIPLYLLATIMTFFVPEIFIGIAFDSGGVISGPMTASFLLPIIIGFCEESGRATLNIMDDSFGLISLVALMPLITIQFVGLLYKYRKETYFSDGKRRRFENDDIIIFPRKKK